MTKATKQNVAVLLFIFFFAIAFVVLCVIGIFCYAIVKTVSVFSFNVVWFLACCL
jgi:cell division septal protein FtsQ